LGNGTVFSFRTNGDFTVLHDFGTGSAGAAPVASLLEVGDYLYGTTLYGGASDDGTVFSIKKNGTNDFRVLRSFDCSVDGSYPYGELISSGNMLYGTTSDVSCGGAGTVFAMNTNGTGFTTLHTFAGTSGTFSTNSGGANPYTGLILAGDTLYGTTYAGGANGAGAVFSIKTNGTGFIALHDFNGGSEGANPWASLVLSGDSVYGTTYNGGASNVGTLFRLALPLPDPELKISYIPPAGSAPAFVSISWPAETNGISYGGYHLIYTPNLSSGAWRRVPAPAIYSVTNYTVIKRVFENQLFFRLFR
jgi:uncharacterized repeat protein (TIGR03803 family)